MEDSRDRLFPRTTPGAFLDIGVNTGQTLADFLSTASAHDYIGLEPNPHGVAFVDTIVSVNRLSRVTLLPVGAAATRGLQTFFVANQSLTDQTATLRTDIRSTADRRVIWVNPITLDEALAALPPAPISLAKIDVEGSELDVLAGATRLLTQTRPPIICEVLLADAQANLADHRARLDCHCQLLHTHDYLIFRLIPTPGALPHLQEMTAFPDGIWSDATADVCDYLFAPRDLDLHGLVQKQPTISPV